MNQTDILALKDFFLHDEFARQNGIEIIEIAEGYARTQVRIEPRHLNAGGYVQGDLQPTLHSFVEPARASSRLRLRNL